MPNRLIDETSPYLLQHAHNPVDWYPWGPGALERAREEAKPLLISIGYAACHWCHVMAHESFEDPDTAREMNESFVCIKIDREERPDLDSVYMSGVQAMTGHGGWPMTVFATPDGKPFYGGTYYPPEPRHGMPAFRQVLAAVAEAWRDRRDEVERHGDELLAHIDRATQLRASKDPLDDTVLHQAAKALLEHLDPEWGGFGGAPKFPQPMTLEFLLRMHLRGVDGALDAVTLTLDKMARGGIFDQVGGGFHRYAVDRIWLVPHFEKMLYDNALLLRLYTRAYQVTGNVLYADTATATATFLLREMMHPDGGFYSSLDADSEGDEGKFYVWDYDELIALAGDDMPLAVAAFAVAGSGNWEGTNVLWRPQPDDEVAAQTGSTPQEVKAALDRVKARLHQAREQRERPGTDDKVLASWNGMTIAALAELGRAIPGGRPFIDAAARAADLVLTRLRRDDGRLLRAWRDGRTSGPAYLEDYAAMADACLTLYETTFEQRWWTEAEQLARAIPALFADAERGGFFDVGADAESPVVRPKDVFDNALPCGNSAAADVLLRVAALTGDDTLEQHAAGFLRLVREPMAQAPTGFGHALCALDRYLARAVEVAVVGDPAAEDARALIEVVHRRFLPNLALAAGPSGSSEPALLRGRPAQNGAATAYVCEDFVCKEPVTTPSALAERL